MEYRDYMKKVENILKEMSDEEKEHWIYEFARTIDKEMRESFLEYLKTSNKQINFNESEFFEFIDDIKNENLYLEIKYEDYYNEIYHDWDEETIYVDSDSLADKIKMYIEIADSYLYAKDYKKAFMIFDTFSSLEIYVSDDEYCGDDYFKITELARKDILNINIEDYLRSYIYCAVQLSKDFHDIFMIFENYHSSLLLTDILSFGPEEIKDVDDFMSRWINYLVDIVSDNSSMLLIDASIYVGGIDKLLQVARQSYKNHPLLYKEVCHRYLFDNKQEEALHIAYEALSRIEINRIIRAEIADMLLEYYPNDQYLSKAAFISQPTAYHFFKACYTGVDMINLKDEFMKVDYSIKEDTTKKLKFAFLENKDILLYEFLMGEDKKIIDICINDSQKLGWSYSLKGKIIPILLMLFKPDHPTYKADMNILYDIQKKIDFKSKDKLSFKAYFNDWKKKYKLSHKDIYIEWLKKEVYERAELIVGGSYRKSYHKSADHIVVLGEILLDNGEINDLNSFINEYRKKYSRKRAFQSEIIESLGIFEQ